MLLESVRSALQRRGYDVTSAEPVTADSPQRDRWRPPDVVAEGDDALACWVVDRVCPSTVIRAQAAARGLEARPLVVGEAVDEGAQPWARRYDVELLDAAALDGASINGAAHATNGHDPSANGSKGSREAPAAGGANGSGPREGPEGSAGDGSPSRPALGLAPPGPGSSHGDEAQPGPDEVDVLSILDPDDPADASDVREPPPWMCPRPTPSEAEPPRPPEPPEPDEASEEGSDPEPDDAPERVPTTPDLAGAPSGPGSRDGRSPARPPAAERPEAGLEGPVDPEPAGSPGASDEGLPWDPVDADPPNPPSNGDGDAVNPPGTPLQDPTEAAAPDGPDPDASDPDAPVAVEPTADASSAGDDGPGTTDLDALVEAAAQSPQPAAAAPAADAAASPAKEGGGEAGIDPVTLGGGPAAASASTDPQKIAEDVMRQEESDPEPADGDRPDGTSPNPVKTGSELLGARPDGGEAEPEPDPDPDTAPWQDDGGEVGGPEGASEFRRSEGDGGGTGADEAETASAEAASGDAPDVQPVGTDDAAMRRHEPDLWDTGGRLDDVRTSLRGAGDSFHARARNGEADAGSSWLDDLDDASS